MPSRIIFSPGLAVSVALGHPPSWVWCHMLVLVTVLLPAVTGQYCDRCNCQISSDKEPQAIYRLSLMCSTGTITWFGASGALRLELMPFLQANFRACFLADSENVQVKVSRETPEQTRPSNYRLHRPEALTLRLDHLVTSSVKSPEFCVHSKNTEPLLLYLEAVRSPLHQGVPKIVFHYDLEKLDAAASQDPMDECRPCSKQEMLDSYCTMDFVVIGSLARVVQDNPADRSNITLHVKQLIHQSQPLFFQRVRRDHAHLTGHVTAPAKCGLQKGQGDFILTGRFRLNSLALRCASYLHEWRTMQHEVECSHI